MQTKTYYSSLFGGDQCGSQLTYVVMGHLDALKGTKFGLAQQVQLSGLPWAGLVFENCGFDWLLVSLIGTQTQSIGTSVLLLLLVGIDQVWLDCCMRLSNNGSMVFRSLICVMLDCRCAG